MATAPVPQPAVGTAAKVEAARAGGSCAILLNGKAGLLRVTAGVEQLERLAHDVGLDATVIVPESSDELRAILRDLVRQGVDRVAVAGGDGTVHLAVQELAHTKTVLGIIPQGTANNFATALRLPQDLPSALRVLHSGVVRKVDLGYACGRYFTEAAGVGLFADTLALYGRGDGKSLFRALWAMGSVVFSFHAHRLKLTVDGQVAQERATMCTIANTYRIAMAMPLAPEAKVTDGQFDVVIVGDLTRRELVQYYRSVRSQLHLNLPKVTVLRGREVTIETRQAMNVHVDDQVTGHTPVTVTLHPHALRVLVEDI